MLISLAPPVRKFLYFFLSILFSFVAFALQLLLGDLVYPSKWLFFYPAVFFSAWVGGLKGGIISTLISATLTWWFFLPTVNSFVIEDPESIFSIIIFIAMGFLFGISHNRIVKANKASSESLAAERSAVVQLENEKRYRRTLDYMIEGCQIIDRDWRYIYINDAAAAHGKLKKEELLGHTMMEMYPGIENTALFDILRTCIDKGIPHRMENEFFYPDGKKGWYDLSIQPVPEGIFILSLEITKNKQAERELMEKIDSIRNNEKLLDSIIENIPDMIYVKNASGLRYIKLNKAGEVMLGFTKEELLEKDVYEIFPEDEAKFFTKTSREVLNNKKTVDIPEETVLTKTAGERILHTRKIPIMDDQGDPLYLLGISEDITDQKILEEKLQEYHNHLEDLVKEKTEEIRQANNILFSINEELSSFSYSVSHDLRSPLRGIDGWSLALEEDYGDKLDDTAKGYINTIRSEVQRMAKLIDALLMLSKVSKTEIKLEKVDLSEFAEKIAADLVKQDENRKADFIIEPGLTANGDSSLLFILIQNLIENAWKFTGKCGRARIEFGKTVVDEKPVFFVRDNGAGFDMAFVNNLFTPFYRLHHALDFPGTGIGLATVRRIIIKHNGTVRAEGEPGKGAAFYFSL
ncbi:MAG: PAS domain S-box protein [Brevinematales bacterium]|nr:PAS domain S-box protein [Brevinematales bacterium]